MATVKIENLSQAILNILEEYRAACAEDVESAAKKAANEAAEELRTTSPVARKHRNKNVYAEGWKVKEKPTTRGTTYIVYNATGYRLTHLLENGHAVIDRNGKRHTDTIAREHIRPAEENAVRTFERLIKENIQKQ